MRITIGVLLAVLAGGLVTGCLSDIIPFHEQTLGSDAGAGAGDPDMTLPGDLMPLPEPGDGGLGALLDM